MALEAPPIIIPTRRTSVVSTPAIPVSATIAISVAITVAVSVPVASTASVASGAQLLLFASFLIFFGLSPGIIEFSLVVAPFLTETCHAHLDEISAVSMVLLHSDVSKLD